MRLDRFDLNLLVALEVLLEEQSVTRAARRLNLTQSAMSAALGRLRRALGDELLLQDGRKMLVTPHAQALAPQVSETIRNLRILISGATAFDPRTSERRFDVVGSDYVSNALLRWVLPRLKREAPGVKVSITLPAPEATAKLEDGKLDLQIAPEEFLSPGHPAELLFEERHVVVGWNGNPVFAGEMTEEAFCSCGHIAARISGQLSFADQHLDKSSLRRRIEVTVPSFLVAPWLLPGTNLLAIMHERLARIYVEILPLEIRPVPVAIPLMREMLQYHAARANDAGLMWLRSQLFKTLRDMHGLASSGAGVA